MSKKRDPAFLVDKAATVDWILKYENGRVISKDDIIAHKISHQLATAQNKGHTTIVCVLGERGSGKSHILDALIRRLVRKADLSIFTTPSEAPTDRSDDLVIATSAVIIPEPIDEPPKLEGIGILFIDVRSWTQSSPFYFKMMELACKFATVTLCSNYKSLSPELSKLVTQGTVHLNREDVTWNGQNILLSGNLYTRIRKRIKYPSNIDHTFSSNLLERLEQVAGIEQQQTYRRTLSRPFVPSALLCMQGLSRTLSAGATMIQGSSASLTQVGNAEQPHHSSEQPNTSQHFRLQYQQQSQNCVAFQVTPPEPGRVSPVNCADAMTQAFASSYNFYFENMELFEHHVFVSHSTSDACAHSHLAKFHYFLQRSFIKWSFRAQTQINDALKAIESNFIRCILNEADSPGFAVDSKIAEKFANNLKEELRNWNIREVDTVVQRWHSYVSFHYKFLLAKLKQELQTATDIFAAYELRLGRILTNDSCLPPQEFLHIAQYIYRRILEEKSEIKSEALQDAVSIVSEQIQSRASEENTRLFRSKSACALQTVEYFITTFQEVHPSDLPSHVPTDPPPETPVSTNENSPEPPVQVQASPPQRGQASVGIHLGKKSLLFAVFIQDGDRTIKYEKALSPYISFSPQGLKIGQPSGDFNVHDVLTEPTVARNPKTLGQDLNPITKEMAAVLYMYAAKKVLRDLCGKDISFACVSIPQLISGAAKTAIKQSLRMVGFTNVELVPFTMAVVMDHVGRHPRVVGKIISIYHSSTVFEISRVAIDTSRGLVVEKTLRADVVTDECVSRCLRDVFEERCIRPQVVLIQEEEGSCGRISHQIKQFGFEHSLGTVESIEPSDTTRTIAKYANLRRQKLSTITIQNDCSYEFRTIGGECKQAQDDSVWIYYHKSEVDGDSLTEEDNRSETDGDFLIQDGVDKTSATAEPRWSYRFHLSPTDAFGPVCAIKFERDGSVGLERLNGENENVRVECETSKFLSQWDREVLFEDARKCLEAFSQPETTQRISGERSGG